VPAPSSLSPASRRGRPSIGVTTAPVQLGDRRADAIQREYSAAVAAAGGIPRLIPSLPHLDAADVWRGLDGLLLTGGGDVDPARYGQQAAPETASVDVERDEVELSLARFAAERTVPVLGICRGCQVLNVAFGGTLVQHLPDVTSQPHLVSEPRSEPAHDVEVAEGSELRAVLGRGSIGVNTVHHQGIAVLAPALRPVAWSPDGLVEGVEHRTRPILGVQWHPESMQGDGVQRRLFEWLVESAASATADIRAVKERA
jgi:putative glutamine amidotransferase